MASSGNGMHLEIENGSTTKQFDVVEATIEELSQALASGVLTSVELVAIYLNRLAFYDRRGIHLNSTPVINPNVFAEAAEADRVRASSDSKEVGPLHGIPFTVKDSFKVKGVTVAAGSPAFADLVANEDSFAVSALRKAGAILLGKTNMPPMAIGGCQRGVYGRAESPYNPDYLPAAWHSGSSSGSGVAVASSLCAFGLGEETVSSGRSPASNNGLVAYTPSRGMISIRGNWPLFPLRDTVVPHTRTVLDMLHILEALVTEDPRTQGDLWRTQQVLELPKPADVRPNSFRELAQAGSLKGLRLGVPKMYIGADHAASEPIQIRTSILNLWQEAQETLTSLGATFVEVDLPVVSAYERDREGMKDLYDRGMLPDGWNDIEINDLVSVAWEEFLQSNCDPDFTTLADIDPRVIHADPPEDVDTRRKTKAHPGRDSINYQRIVDGAKAPRAALPNFPRLPAVLAGLERARTELFERWLNEEGLDAVVFPANADVAPSDADTNPESSEIAWRNGVVFSNMNHVMRHLGIPSVTVPMGIMQDIGMPVGITFIGPAYSDSNLLLHAFDYEAASKKRQPPTFTPPIPQGSFPAAADSGKKHDKDDADKVQLQASVSGHMNRSGDVTVTVEVNIEEYPETTIRIFVDGVEVESKNGIWVVEIPAEVRRRSRMNASWVIVLGKTQVTGEVSGLLLEAKYKR